jgi:alpha-tubulin suppressor-like RCC1 family protein
MPQVALLVRRTLVIIGVASAAGLLTFTTSEPALATAPLQNIVQIDAGQDYACALRANGRVMCWGANGSGQLGDGTFTGRATPREVVGLQDVVQISAGDGHACALTEAAALKCWGYNSSGQLGAASSEACILNSSALCSTTPVSVAGLMNITFVTAGAAHTCALTAAGGVKCWGSDLLGELGNGPLPGGMTPTDVVGLSSGVTALSAGSITCAVTESAAGLCWGVCDPTPCDQTVPDQVDGITAAVSVSAGSAQRCFLLQSGAVECPGWLVDPPDSGVQAIAVGGSPHACALMATGGVQCWGFNGVGQLGDGTVSLSGVPVQVYGLTSNVQQIDAGGLLTCALLSDGTARCWGDNTQGQLGNNLPRPPYTPSVVTAGKPDPVGGVSREPAMISSHAPDSERFISLVAGVAACLAAGAVLAVARRTR